MINSKRLIEASPAIAEEWHPTKNGNLTPNCVTYGSAKKVWWKCDEKHEWIATIGDRISKESKCPYCTGRKATETNCLYATHPKLAEEWHPTKNGNLTPNCVTYGSTKKVWWKCDEKHEWIAIIGSRSAGSECPYCTGKKATATNCLYATHPKLAKEWHPVKNENLTPAMVTAGSGKRVWWKCEKEHEWVAIIANRSRTIDLSCGCPFCTNKKIDISNCLLTKFPEIAKEWHPTKNNDLTPFVIGGGSSKKVWWKCEKEHEYNMSCDERCGNRKYGCPICKESKGEKFVASYFYDKKIMFDRQVSFDSCRNKKVLPFDFAIYYNNKMGLIEYQGEQHYLPCCFGGEKINLLKKLQDIQHRDQIKRQWCLKNKYLFLEIPYTEENIGKLIDDFLLSF